MRMLLVAAIALSASAHAAYDWRYLGDMDGMGHYLDLGYPGRSHDDLPQASLVVVNPKPGWFGPAGYTHLFSVDCRKNQIWLDRYIVKNKDASARQYFDGRPEAEFPYEHIPVVKLAVDVVCGKVDGNTLPKPASLPSWVP